MRPKPSLCLLLVYCLCGMSRLCGRADLCPSLHLLFFCKATWIAYWTILTSLTSGLHPGYWLIKAPLPSTLSRHTLFLGILPGLLYCCTAALRLFRPRLASSPLFQPYRRLSRYTQVLSSFHSFSSVKPCVLRVQLLPVHLSAVSMP